MRVPLSWLAEMVDLPEGLGELTATLVRQPIPATILIDEPVGREALECLVQPSGQPATEVRPRKADRGGKSVNVAAGRRAQSAQELVLESFLVHRRPERQGRRPG